MLENELAGEWFPACFCCLDDVYTEMNHVFLCWKKATGPFYCKMLSLKGHKLLNYRRVLRW